MKTQFRLVVFSAALAFALTAHSQVTYVNTDSSTGTVSLTQFGVGSGLGAPTTFSANTAIQTISGFSSLSNIAWTLTGDPGATFSTYVAQWDATNNNASGSLTQFGTADLSFAGGTGALTFSQSLTGLNPSLTYALLLTTTSAGAYNDLANVGLASAGGNNGASQAFFGSSSAGYAATSFLSGLGTFTSDLATNGSGQMFTSGNAYTMSVSGTLAAVPEPKTAAAAIAALFVAALIGRRTWQRRKLVAIPVVA